LKKKEEIVFLKTKEIFEKSFFQEKHLNNETIMCSISGVIQKDNPIIEHNCLGCNLQDDVILIKETLNSIEKYSELKFAFEIYLMSLYLMTEKILHILKIIGLPKSYKENMFEVFRTVKLWANFFKHPKAFILTHHPEYYFETNTILKHFDKKDKVITKEFLVKYYTGEDDNKYKNLVSELRHNNNVKVIFPRVDKLTTEFANACKEFIGIINDNKAYREILNDLATLEIYFSNLYKTEEN
jgi:hypothetical protein